MVQSGVCFHSERKLQSEDLAFQLELLPFLVKLWLPHMRAISIEQTIIV